MQDTGNLNHFYIARYEASLKYIILKCSLIKTLLHKQLTETETSYISKIYKYINIFKEKSNLVVDFMPMFACFRRYSSLFLPRVLN